MELRPMAQKFIYYAVFGILISLDLVSSFRPDFLSTKHENAQFVSNLLAKSKQTKATGIHRRLDEVDVDLSGYEIKFERCQFVKAYSDDLAQDEDSNTVLELQKFIVYRLCPSGTCGNCLYDYGEYIIDMQTYLEIAIGYFEEYQENMCNQCNEVCANDDGGGDDAADDAGNDGVDDANNRKRRLDIQVDCDECVSNCEKIEEMEDRGYVEASNYLECQQIFESDDGAQFYAGAMCSGNGQKVKIGVFSDENCYEPQSDLNVEAFLGGVALSHALLKQIYDQNSCVSCTELDWEIPDDDGQKNDDEVVVNEMCENLYELSGKCESNYGFDNYWKEYDEYINQYKEEDNVCDFIGSVVSGNYDQSGEIVLSGSFPSVPGTQVTLGQVIGLAVFGLGTIIAAYYAATFYKRLKESKNALLLDEQGTGTMT